MSRSTDRQKAERLNAAHGLLVRGTSMAEAAVSLAREFDLSRRQAYRYLRTAQALEDVVPLVESTVPITIKVPANVVRELRAYAAASGLTMGAIVGAAITAFLATRSRHG